MSFLAKPLDWPDQPDRTVRGLRGAAPFLNPLYALGFI